MPDCLKFPISANGAETADILVFFSPVLMCLQPFTYVKLSERHLEDIQTTAINPAIGTQINGEKRNNREETHSKQWRL